MRVNLICFAHHKTNLQALRSANATPIQQHKILVLPVRICLNASSTPVESKAEVSINAKLLLSAKAMAVSVLTARLWRRSLCWEKEETKKEDGKVRNVMEKMKSVRKVNGRNSVG